jgi:hypothetical protein
MATIVTRAGKGSPLTNNEVDSNFTNLNTAKIETITSTDGSVTVTGTDSTRNLSVPVNPAVVSGPVSATDNAIARFDATTGKLIQNSVVIVGDTGSITGVNALTAESLVINNNATLGSSNTDTLDVNARITTDLDPNVNNAKDIGTSGRNWRDGFFGRTLSTVNLEITGTTSFDGSQGTSGQVLTSAGTGNTPTWTTPTVGTVTSVSGTAGRITSTGGATPVIDLASGVATAGTTGSSTLIPVVTIDTYGRVTGITTAANPQGTVTSVTGTSPVVSSGGATPAISLATAYGDTVNPYASKTANFILAAPNGTTGVPTFRAVVAADIPTLNQNTTGNAATATTLQTARTINGVSFNGSANITVTATATSALTLGSFLTGTSYNGSTAVTAAVDATSANTASKVVARDASGNFSAGTITAALSGNASTATSATNATNVAVTNDTTTNATHYFMFGDATSGNDGVKVSNTKATFNPSTGTAVFAGDVTSNSDERLKTNWRSVGDDFVTKLAGVKSGVYDRTDIEATQAGVSAQSLEEVLAEVVMTAPDGIKSVNYGNAALVAAVELAKQVVELRKEIAELKGKL